jgi:YaaC-like Protein
MMIDISTVDVWGRLGLFRSQDVLRRKYELLHTRRLPLEKAKQIAAHLDQATQYFRSSESAGHLAGPLEQYYGVLAFARAVILYLDPRARESTLRHGHGLRGALVGSSLESMRMRVENGTFTELIDAIGNTQTLLIPDVQTTSYYGFAGNRRLAQKLPRPTVGSAFSLLDLVARIPQLRELFESAFDQRASCHIGGINFVTTGSSIARVQISADKFGLPKPEQLGDALGISRDTTAVITPRFPDQEVVFELSAASTEELGDRLPLLISGVNFRNSLIERFPGGWALTELAMLFATSNALSNFVRYHPTRWAALVNHEDGDRLLPIVESARGLIQTRIPALVLTELER